MTAARANVCSTTNCGDGEKILLLHASVVYDTADSSLMSKDKNCLTAAAGKKR